MNISLSKIYDLRITLLDRSSWNYLDLYFHFFDIDISNKWIQNFIDLKSGDHYFNERAVFIKGKNKFFESSNDLRKVIDIINEVYDIEIPKFETFDRENLSQLHVYYENYGNRIDNKTPELDRYFSQFNTAIHRVEYSIRNKTTGSMLLASFYPRKDFNLSKEAFAAVLPVTNFGDLYLGYNTLGKNLHQAIRSNDSKLIEQKMIQPQQTWSNEIMAWLTHSNNVTEQLLEYKTLWDNLEVNSFCEYGNFYQNKEGYVVIGEMIPEQKDKFYSHVSGVDESFLKFDEIFSIDLVSRRRLRNFDILKRSPEWKYPVPVQGQLPIKIDGSGVSRITWVLNNICNYACRYCPEVLHNGKNPKYQWEHLEPFIDHLLDFYSSDQKEIHFSLTGGEPTLSPFFPTLIKKIYDKGHRCGITTNLSRTVRYIEENFKYLDYVSASFHPVYEFVDNKDREFLEKCKIISTITSITVRVMMDPLHWEKCLSFVDELKAIPGVNVSLVMIDSQYGYSSRKIADIDYTEEQLLKFKDFNFDLEFIEKTDNKLFRPVTKYPIITMIDGSTNRILDPQEYINRGQTNFWNWKCNIGKESLFIDHTGDIQRANCGVSGHVGTIDSWQTIDWNRLKESISCTSLMCHCGTDVLVSKESNR